MQKRDSIFNTFLVATLLCLFCSALVSVAAVGLKSIQDTNVTLDRKKNLLEVSGFTLEEIDEAGGIEKLFEERFQVVLIDLETGEDALDAAYEAFQEVGKKFGDGSPESFLENYDQFWASKSKNELVADPMPKGEDAIRIKYREKYSHVYIKMSEDGESVESYIFPIRGYGLWSMLKGYIAVKPDFQTVIGITFYEQKETPGLGGEVTNPDWKAKWADKLIYEGEEVGIEVVKGEGAGEYQVDGLSGATITSNGVTNMLDYWLGPSGFQNYIEKQKSGTSSASVEQNNNAGATNG
ncbi:MAG: Na(+)-translocating NADH-quinone reductase subunit C [Planctomycetota bacterium]